MTVTDMTPLNAQLLRMNETFATQLFANNRLDIKKVIYNPPATIIIWNTGEKTVVKCSDNDVYSKETGFFLCIAKKLFGNDSRFNKILDKWYWSEKDTAKENKRTEEDDAEDRYAIMFNDERVLRDITRVVLSFMGDENTMNLLKQQLEENILPERFAKVLPMPDYLKKNFHRLPEYIRRKTTNPIKQIILELERTCEY